MAHQQPSLPPSSAQPARTSGSQPAAFGVNGEAPSSPSSAAPQPATSPTTRITARALAGPAIQEAAGKPFSAAATDDVLEPLGLTATYDLEEIAAREHAAPHPGGAAGCTTHEPVNSLHVSIGDELTLLEQVVEPTPVAAPTWAARYAAAPQGSPALTNAHPFGTSLPLDSETTLVIPLTGAPGYQQCSLVVPERGFVVALLGNLHGAVGWRAPCEQALELA